MATRHFGLLLLTVSAGGCALVANYDFGKYGRAPTGGAGGTAGITVTGVTSTTTGTTTLSTNATGSTGTSPWTSTSVSVSTGGNCTGTCVTLPVGWSGPVEVALGAGAVCPAAFPQLLSQEPAAVIPVPQPSWCGCTCDPQDCKSGVLTLYSTASCQVGSTSLQLNACTAIPQNFASASFTPTFNPNSQCKAAPTIGIPGLVTNNATVCGTTSTCSPDVACAPPGSQLCIEIAGAVDCPAGFSTHYILDSSGTFVDGRTCTACTCGQWQQPGCIGGAQLWDAGGCTGSFFGVPAQGTCENVGTFKAVSAGLALQPAGTCTHSTSVPTGSVSSVKPTTICCQ